MQLDVGVVVPHLDHYGGAEIYLLECLRRWQREMRITLYTGSFRRALLREYGVSDDRVKVEKLPRIAASTGRLRWLDELVVVPRLWERAIGRHDLYFLYLFPMHFVRKTPSVFFAAEPLRMLYDLRHEIATGEEGPVHVYPRMRYESVQDRTTAVVMELLETLDRGAHIERLATNSRKTSGYLETVYGRPADLIAPPGVNLPEEMTAPPDTARAIFAGRLWRHKRVDLAVHALAHLDRGELVIVGDGPERATLEKLALELGVEGRVHFKGSVSAAEIDELYRDSTCGVYTPIREPFGMMPVEVAAMGRPVVVSPDGGYTEILDHRCAQIVPPDPPAIAEALRELFEEPGLAAELGRAARLKCSLRTWDRTAEELAEFFRSSAERPVRGSMGRRAPLLGAHYYPWYESGEVTRHWNENLDYGAVVDDPALGQYSSGEEATIASHLRMAQEAGLDFLVVNVEIGHQGIFAADLAAAERLFDAVEASGAPLRLAILASIATADADRIQAALVRLRSAFVHRSSYLRVRDLPAFWFFLSGDFLGHLYQHHRELEEATDGLLRIATGNVLFDPSLPRSLREFFAGWSLYSPLQVGPGVPWKEVWERGYEAFRHSTAGRGVNVFSVSPGYDDTSLTLRDRAGSPHRRISRKDGDTYRAMQEAALDLDPAPALVVVTSFNEFHENTHIEPSERYGDLYLRETRRFKEALVRRFGPSAALKANSRTDPEEVPSRASGGDFPRE